jgi:two-component system CheB/CheR fusion protein
MANQPRFPLVGIGASAGGLEALEGFFRSLPADGGGLAFVIVTHLAPGRQSPMADILGRFVPLQVLPARDGVKVEVNHVYVLSTDALLRIEGGRLRVREGGAARHPRNPIDVFFASLAEDQGQFAVGIVLSGAGSDGTLGVKAIKEQGGLTLAQGIDHTVPRHSGMPSSAIASGLVDLVLPVEEMPGRLIDYARGFETIGDLAETPHTDRLTTVR